MELKAEYTRLQESYRELERMKDSLEDKKATCQLNLTDAQKEAEKTRTEVRIFTSKCTCIHLITVYCKKMGGSWRWALVSLDGVAPSRMVSVSASVNLPLHHEVQKFSYGTGSPGWSRKKGLKTVVVVDDYHEECND